jgi:hypothetical protein
MLAINTSDTELQMPDEKTPGHVNSVADSNGRSLSSYNEKQYYMSGPKLGILIAGLCLALFLLGLDTAIVSTVSNPAYTFL